MQSQGHAFFMAVFVVRSELLHIIFSKEHSQAESVDNLQGRQIKPFAITTTSCNLKNYSANKYALHTSIFQCYAIVICERQHI